LPPDKFDPEEDLKEFVWTENCDEAFEEIKK